MLLHISVLLRQPGGLKRHFDDMMQLHARACGLQELLEVAAKPPYYSQCCCPTCVRIGAKVPVVVEAFAAQRYLKMIPT